MCAFLAWLFTLCAPVHPVAWAASLPTGDPPEVPYVVGTTLHLPDGERVRVEGEDVSVVGATERGTMLLVEWLGHVWVTPDGTTTVQPEVPWAGVQDEVVSPDGRWFARGDAVVDLADGTVVATIPARAQVLTGWTAAGIELWGDGRRWIWQPGDRPRRLRVSDRPPFRVTRELRVVDRQGRDRGYLAGGPLLVGGPPTSSYWTSSREVLVALPEAVVRCDIRTFSCERALDRTAELPVR